MAAFMLAVLSLAAPAWAASSAYLSKTAGIVQLRKAGMADWDNVANVPLDLNVSDSVRTGSRAQATLMFADGSRIELGPNASFQLEDAAAGKSGIRLNFGWIKAFVNKVAGRKFQVRTPTAVCSVRGTEFRVEVENGGRTTVDLYKGLLGVEDRRGQQILLHPNERVQIDLRGLGRTNSVPSKAQVQKSQFHVAMQREMLQEMSREQVLANAAREIKLAEYQQGKALIDAFGNRVRVEQYIVRPAPNQFELVIINSRKDRFDYFAYLGTFNQTLPSDMRLALSQLNGSVGVAPTWFLTSYTTFRSNTIDSIREIATGGHVVNVNATVDPTEAVAQVFNGQTNSFVNVAGRPVFKTLFDNYGFYIDGKLKYGWTGNNIQTYNAGYGAAGPTAATTNDPITGALLAAALPTRTFNTTIPDPNQLHQILFESYSDGTYTKWDNYIISDQGQVATPGQFAASTAGVGYIQGLMKWNYEQVITSSEFQGRKIDLVVAPKMLVQAGLIQ